MAVTKTLLQSSHASGVRALFAKSLSSTAERVPAPKTSTVHRGNAFEERSLEILQQNMSMALRRVGGKEDGGVDLLGWWWLPHETSELSSSTNTTISPSFQERRRIRVIGQCKAEKKKMGPNYVRELEGVLYRFLTDKSDNSILSLLAAEENSPDLAQSTSIPMVALLVSQSAFTKATVLRANSSPIPFFLLHLPEVDDGAAAAAPVGEAEGETVDSDGDISSLGTVWCNPALCNVQGLLKGRMEVRWERHSEGERGRPALWWDGLRLPSWIPESTPLLGDPQSQVSSLQESA